MGDDPAQLRALLEAPDAAARDRAWEAFTARYSGVLLAAAGARGWERDETMDAYAHILECLRADDGRRLRAYRPAGSGSFTTWLTIVARRLAVDFHRHRHGRPRGEDPAAATAWQARRRLADLVGVDQPLDTLPAPGAQPAEAVERAERRDALGRALAALAPQDRLLVRLRFEDDASVRDIARLMGFPSVFHVYRRLDRVLSTLRGALHAAGIDGPSS